MSDEAARRLKQASEALERYVALERQFIEGGADEIVSTVNGDYPTLAGLVAKGRQAADLLDQANAALADAQALKDAASASASAAADSATAANNAASSVAAAVGVVEYHHGRALLLGGVAY